MYNQGVLVVAEIDYRLGQIALSHLTDTLHNALKNTLPRHMLNEVCFTTYKDIVKQIVENTSDNHADFCFNLLSLPNYTGLRYAHGEHHPLAYLNERELISVNHAIRELGLSLFFVIKNYKPSGMYLMNVSHVDSNSVGLIFKPTQIESIL